MTTANVNIKKVLLKRGNTTQNNNYLGVYGEVSVDMEAKTLRIHDGVTTGGNILTAAGAVGSYSNTNVAAYLTSQSITSANIGAFQTYANSNAVSQTTEINSLRANITAANVAITNLQSNAAVQQALLDTLTGNAATQAVTLNTLTSNAATQADTLNTLLSNAIAQQTSLIDLVANAATQAQAIANVSGTYSNSNVKSYLGAFDGNILPSANVTYSLGDATHQWKDLWVSNNTIYIGNTPIRVDGSTLLINGSPVTGAAGNVASLINGAYTFNLFANGHSRSPDTIFASNGVSIISANSVIQGGMYNSGDADWFNIGAGAGRGFKFYVNTEDPGPLFFANGSVNVPSNLYSTAGIIGDVSMYGGTISGTNPNWNNLTLASQIEGYSYIQLPTDATANVANLRIHNDIGNVELATGDGVSYNYWYFRNDGDLNLPTNGDINFNGGGIGQTINEDFTIRVQDQEDDGWSVIQVVDDGAGTTLGTTQLQRDSFRVQFAGGSQPQFRFADNGELQLPGNVRWDYPYINHNLYAVSDNNGDGSIELKTQSYSNDTLGTNIRASWTHASISTNNAQYNWVFDNTGTLTAPGNIISGGGQIQFIANSSGDGNGYATMRLIPDIDREFWDQYLIVDPTAPGHIHIRAGGTQDNSNADLILGGENSYVKVTAGSNPPVYIRSNSYDWQFGTDGTLTLPGGLTFSGSPGPTVTGIGDFDTYNATVFNNLTVANIVQGSNTWQFSSNGNLVLPGVQSPMIQSGHILNVKGIHGLTATSGAQIDGFSSISAATVSAANFTFANGTSILSYVDNQISNLVNNAPALLDTLGEIAANLATEANAVGSVLNSLTSTNANVAAANVNINTLLGRVDQAVNMTSSPQFAGLTTTANVEMTGNVHIHQNLVVDGNINFIGNVTQTNITTANAVFTGDTYGFGALYAGTLGYTPLPYTVIQATADYNDYSQINFQNLNLSANASTEYVATAGNGNDTTNYIDIGIAGGAWNGLQFNSVGTAAKANDAWIYVVGNTTAGTGGNLVLGTIQPNKRVNILTGGPGSGNIYSYFDSNGLTTANVYATRYLYANGVSILSGISGGGTYSNTNVEAYIGGNIGAFQIFSNANSATQQTNINSINANIGAFQTYANATFGSGTSTGNITFSDTTISTSGGAGQGIILNSAGAGEIAMMDYVGINNTNPGYWLHIGDGSLGAVNNTGNISVDYNNGLNSSRGSTILGYAWWDTGGNGNNNRGIGAHRQFGIYKNDDLYTTKYIEFDLNSGNANLTNIAVTRVTTTNGIFWSNGTAFASSNYGNTEVAAYLTIAPAITGIQANLGAFQTFSNSNSATQQTSIDTVNANLGSFQTYANTTFGVSSYGNTQVAAYLLTYPSVNVATLNTTSGNIVTLRTANFNSANAVISGGYVSALTNASVITATLTTVNSTAGNITTLAASNFSTANAVVTGGYATGLANISVTGNATVGNLVGTSPNTTIISGAYTSTFDNVGNVILPNLYVSGNTTAIGIAAGYAPNRPAFRVYGSGNTGPLTTAVNGNGYLNGWNFTADYNQGNYLNTTGALNSTTAGVFTAPVAGLYQICLNGRNAGNLTTISQLVCYKNPTTTAAIQLMLEFGSNSSMNHTGVTTVSRLATGDTLALKVMAGTITFDGNDNWSVTYIG